MKINKYLILVELIIIISPQVVCCQLSNEDTSWFEKSRTYDSSYNPSAYSQMAAAGSLYCQVEKFNGEIVKSIFPLANMEFLKEYANKYSNMRLDNLQDISNIAKSFDGIAINEAHDNPLTRLVAIDMLDSFRKLGYSQLFMEALYLDPANAEVNDELGLYFRDPVLVYQYRKAQKMGYKILSYDTLLSNQIIRDSLEAERIISKIIPNEQFIILCGYDHGSKSDLNTESMLNVLRRRTNLKVLNFDTYKYSFTGMLMEKAIAKVLSPKIDDPNWYALVKGVELEAFGLESTGYDYHVVYKTIPCSEVRPFVLTHRVDLKSITIESKSEGMISVYAYGSSKNDRSSYLFDRLFVSKGVKLDIGIPQKSKYYIKYEPIENLIRK